MELEKYLCSEVIALDLASGVKEDAIREISDLLVDVHGLSEPAKILKTLYLREADRSTGIGNGVAIPHARTDLVGKIFLAFARSKKGIEWGSVDGRPVHFIFLVVGPKKASQEYLQLLADISRLMSRAGARQAIFEAASADRVLTIVGETRVRKNRIKA